MKPAQLQQHGSRLASSSAASTQQERTSGGVGDRPGSMSRECVICVPKDKKCPAFSGGSCAEFYKWLVELPPF